MNWTLGPVQESSGSNFGSGPNRGNTTYRVNAWFLTVITILLGPPILAALTYSSWLRPRLELSVFVANHAASLPFALTVLSAHGTLLCFVYGEFCLILNAVLQH